MLVKYRKNFKRLSYLGITLLSFTFTDGLQAKETSLKDQIDYHIKGGSIKIPKAKKDIADVLEKKINYFRRHSANTESEVEKDIRSPVSGAQALYNYSSELLEKEQDRYARLVRHIDSLIDGGDEIIKTIIKHYIKNRNLRNILIKKADKLANWLKKKNHEDD